ncbi:20283_t:CDS:2, partial [Cetraspora pellucida]
MTSAMVAKSKYKLEYKIREYVKILILKIDQFDKLNYNETFKYYFECKSGILNNLYCANELKPLGIKEYPELNNIPTDNISVREAVQTQNTDNGFMKNMC